MGITSNIVKTYTTKRELSQDGFVNISIMLCIYRFTFSDFADRPAPSEEEIVLVKDEVRPTRSGRTGRRDRTHHIRLTVENLRRRKVGK